MLTGKRLLTIFLIPFFFISSIWLGYIITYNLLETNVPSLTLSGDDIRVIQVTLQNIHLVSEFLMEYFNSLNSGKKLDSKKINDNRILISQIQREYDELIRSVKGNLLKSVDNIVKDFKKFLDRVDTLMKFPNDEGLANIICVDLRNLLKTIRIFSANYRLKYEYRIDRLIEEFEEKCKH